MPTDPSEIIDYWLGTDQNSVEAMKRQGKLWYTVSSETDNRIRTRFGATLNEAETGHLDDWQNTGEGSLALVILLDQFSRNLYRGSSDAYRNDEQAFDVADHAVATGQHHLLSVPARVMLYHPYHHAESESGQQKAVELFTELKNNSAPDWHDELENHLSFVRSHAETVRRFGRFPHRNTVLNRTSTPEEMAFLEKDSRSYGQ